MLESEAEKLNKHIDEIATHAFKALRALADFRESQDPAARSAYTQIHRLIADLGTLRMQVEILGRDKQRPPQVAVTRSALDPGRERDARDPIDLAVIDAYGIVMAGIAAVLAPYDDRVHVLEFQGRGRPPQGSVDIVLYDTFGPVHDRDLDRDISRLVSTGDARVVVFSWNFHPDRVARALRRGAAGYLSKSLSAEEIVIALERVHAGETVVAPDPTTAGTSPEWPGRDRGLTHREAQIVTLIARGLNNHEIASRLSLSSGAVKICIRSAYRKIGISRRAKVIGWAISQGFLLTDLGDPDQDRPDPVRRSSSA